MLLNAKKHFYLLLFICIVALLSLIFIRERYNNGLFIGDDAYYSLRTAQYIHDTQSLPKEDSLSYGGRLFVNEYGWPLILSINPQFLGRWLPFILGILSFIFFYFIVKNYNDNIKGLASLFLILSPAYIYLYSTPSKYGIVLFMLLLGIYLSLRKKETASIIVLGLTGFFSILTLLIILLYNTKQALKNHKWEKTLYLSLFLLSAFIIQFYKLLYAGLPEVIFGFNSFTLPRMLNLLFSDFGSIFGISIFTFFLSLIGVYTYWKQKYKFLLYYIILTVLIFGAFYFNFLIFYLTFILAFFAALGFNNFLNHEWRSNTLRYFTILVVICGIIFSGLAFLNEAPNVSPSKGFKEAFDFLKGQNSTSMVFSDYTRGNYISYVGRINFIDDNTFYARNVQSRLLDSRRLLHAKNINTATSIINRYNIQYIWLDKDLITHLWGKSETELIFLLRYSPNNFKKMFDNGDVEIYEYIRQPGNYTS
ncbi:MAG: hypothetical protein AABX19_00255 [Nanoarchaeota archaeon]